MIKLYKDIDGTLFYVEFWTNKNVVTEHYGVVGNHGKSKESICDDPIEFGKCFVKKYAKQGYREIPQEEQYMVEVKYPIAALDAEAERAKDSLVHAFNELLGWNGLGHVDGFDVDINIPEPKRPFMAIFRKPQRRYITIFLQLVDLEKIDLFVKQIMEQNNISSYQVAVRSIG